MSDIDALEAHLATGASTVCRCWQVTRRDGTRHGFTDHDRDLSFEGQLFRAETGMSASALSQSTGLSVDNAEAVGALSDIAITEADIEAGRYDGAEVTAWLVNWQNVNERVVQFRGSLGEITRAGELFRAELRGRTEALNRPQGLIYHASCAAVLGDARCGVDLASPAFSVELAADAVRERQIFEVAAGDFAEGWFERGRLTVLTGEASGLSGAIRTDRAKGAGRELTLWLPMSAPVAAGDTLRLEAGCDKRAETCKAKFGNFLRFRGFPHIPGEDWLISYPVRGDDNAGGSLS